MKPNPDRSFAPAANAAGMPLEQLVIFDTTLRDGAHSPLVSFSEDEKLAIAEALRETGVDIVEIGMPGASPEEFRLVARLSSILREARVAVLAKPTMRDIESAVAAASAADRMRLHTFISTSPPQMQAQDLHPDAVLEAISDSVSFARRHTDDVEWSSEDGTRSDFDFLCRCVETAIKAGATTINLPDSAGWITPDEYRSLFEKLRERIGGASRVIFSVHCHDDLGLALANTLAGVQGGARQIECTLRGLGARAGNTATGEWLRLMRTRPETLPFRTSIDPSAMARADALVSTIIDRRSAAAPLG